nr:synaptobrevin, longin-like domain protein [Tanacetum cinerariifolium]
FWSTARIETTADGTQILATVDGVLRTVTESSLRRNLKLHDEAGISSLPDTELFENLTLMGYNISPNQKFTFQKGQFSHQWKFLIHTIMQCLIPKSTGFNEFSSNIATTLVCLATNRTYNFSKMIFDGLVKNINNKVSNFFMHYTRRARIAQSSALPPVADEPASPMRDVSEGEAFPTDSGFIADQDRATIAKSSTLPHDTAPRVTSPAAVEGSMQQTINELTALCTSLQRQHSKLLFQFKAQEVEINKLKERVKILEDNQGVIGVRSTDDAPIKGMRIDEEEGITGRVSSDTEEIRMDEGEVAVERTSEDTEEMTIVLTSMDAATVLAGGIDVPTSSYSIPTVGPPAVDIHTGSDAVPTASPIIATATVVTPYSRRKGKEVMVESDTPKKQRDVEVAMIHAEEELQGMIDSLDKTNETIAKRVRNAQSSALPTVIDEPVSLDRATITKSSTLPHDSAPRVTSPADDEGSMQQTISELTDLCTSLQRQHSELLAKFQAQEVEILKLKDRVKVLEDREGIAATRSGDDAPIKGRSIDEGEAATEKISDDSEELARILTSIDATTVLGGGIDVPTGSGSIPTAGPPVVDIHTGSDAVPTASPIIATAT